MIDDKTTTFPMKQLDSVKRSNAENVNYTIKRVEIVAACQFGQAKYCLTACSRKCDEPDNICFVECKNQRFPGKGIKIGKPRKSG
ncbi:hypothetical protein HMPREF1640_09660 [Prevotella sp. S7-1-8]|nr:hypothetical protein HMPREF1640_09660 [Prevotella sp. S7-1-8]